MKGLTKKELKEVRGGQDLLEIALALAVLGSNKINALEHGFGNASGTGQEAMLVSMENYIIRQFS